MTCTHMLSRQHPPLLHFVHNKVIRRFDKDCAFSFVQEDIASVPLDTRNSMGVGLLDPDEEDTLKKVTDAVDVLLDVGCWNFAR